MSLVDAGIKQGAIIDCKNLPTDIAETISNSRAIISYRSKPVTAERKLVVLSQDCDIYNCNDPYIEVIVISLIKENKQNEGLQNNRSYKKLQLPMLNGYWLFEAELISVIKKDIFDNHKLVIEGELPEREHQILIDWRVGRYNRRPLPDGFNKAFLIDYIKTEGNSLGDLLEKNAHVISDLFVYVSPFDDETAEEYCVGVTALIFQDRTDEEISNIELEIKKHCEILHNAQNPLKMYQIDGQYYPTEDNPPIDFALRLADFSFFDATKMRRLNLDYLCYTDHDFVDE